MKKEILIGVDLRPSAADLFRALVSDRAVACGQGQALPLQFYSQLKFALGRR
jgi:hypothetical protein